MPSAANSSPSILPSGPDADADVGGGDGALGGRAGAFRDAAIKAEWSLVLSGCGTMERGGPAGPGCAERTPGGAALRGQPAGGCGPWEMRDRLGTGGFGNVCLYQHQVGRRRGGQGGQRRGDMDRGGAADGAMSSRTRASG